MANVELIYDGDCPNVEAARRQLRISLGEAGHPVEWTEWDRSHAASPQYAQQYGSPTILVDGRDVAGQSPTENNNCCRLYRDESGVVHGVPSVEAITSALNSPPSEPFRSWLPILPAVGVSLLPKLACPACWPAYAGLLSAFGLGFLANATYLLPLTVAFLIVAVGALGWRAKHRRGFGPFALGVLAGTIVVVGKFSYNSNLALYGGIALLVGASLWNSWPDRSASASCPACETGKELHQIKTTLEP